MSIPDYMTAAAEGVWCIDTGFQRPRFDAAWLLVDGGRAAFVDTGTNFALPRLLGALDALGLARAAVDWVIPTHVHLDHAGGAGRLMAELPAARLVAHPRGAPHLIDPARLWAGALAVYGEAEMERSYGQLLPVAAGRVVTSSEGMTIAVGARALRFADTPGHARHHHCIWDAASRGWFSGDTFGMSYPEFADCAHGRWMLPTTTPVQLDPPALRESIARLLAFEPAAMYVTHFGRIDEPARRAVQLLSLLDEMIELATSLRARADRPAALRRELLRLYRKSLAAQGCRLDDATVAQLLAPDVELNAQGLEVWLDR